MLDEGPELLFGEAVGFFSDEPPSVSEHLQPWGGAAVNPSPTCSRCLGSGTLASCASHDSAGFKELDGPRGWRVVDFWRGRSGYSRCHC